MDLACQLPKDLQPLALTKESSDVVAASDFIQQVWEEGNISESRAEKQVMSAWRALKHAVSKGEIENIKEQLPRDLSSQLY